MGNQCLFAIECKYYAADLGLGLARDFEGLHADMRSKHKIFVANTNGASVVKYLSAKSRRYERHVIEHLTVRHVATTVEQELLLWLPVRHGCLSLGKDRHSLQRHLYRLDPHELIFPVFERSLVRPPERDSTPAGAPAGLRAPAGGPTWL